MTEIRPEQEFFAHLAQGKFMLQRSRSSGKCFFYPRVAEPVTGARNLEWVEASGRGTVHATTVVRVKPPQQPYNVVLVDLEEGPRVMSRVEGMAPDAVYIGMKVQARIGSQDERPLLLFDMVTDTGNK
ncbi:Zn-ribbon domain-containing OB-fold protein [Polaromonas sp. SM01]|uniref:Zn-ribbon domain-containing OB-fold protein n=1 Tax=Polaromonas sp. SM01 TaxID=3085630 RepID=UPI00298102A1|nr:Zn-ribbon domain-containing OB-fold protein [Polaromonas sp. SM01]MDW5444159.1 Zn-ribbon domain-containing OB-fold protein [Polaromonas sp. SM01]